MREASIATFPPPSTTTFFPCQNGVSACSSSYAFMRFARVRHSIPVTRAFSSPNIRFAFWSMWNSTPSSFACSTSSARAGISAALRR